MCCLVNLVSPTSLIAQLVKNLPAMQETLAQFLGREDPWRRNRLSTPVFLGFPCGLAGKESTCNAGDLGLTPGLGRSPGEGRGYQLRYSGLENSINCIVHGVTKSWTRLSDFHFTSPPHVYLFRFFFFCHNYIIINIFELESFFLY